MTNRNDAIIVQTTKPLRWEGDRVGFVAFQYNGCSLDSSTADGAEQNPSPPTAHPHNPNITNQPLQKTITPTKKITFFLLQFQKHTHRTIQATFKSQSSISSAATKHRQTVVPERRIAQMGKAEASVCIFSGQGDAADSPKYIYI